MFTAKGAPASVTRRCLVPGMNSFRRALYDRGKGYGRQEGNLVGGGDVWSVKRTDSYQQLPRWGDRNNSGKAKYS